SSFNDILKGDANPNSLTGQGGADTFVYVSGGSSDTSTDFDRSSGTFSHAEGDKIDLTGVANVHGFGDLHPVLSNGNTVIDFGSGDSLTLTGVTSVVASDFIFNPINNQFV